MHKLRVSFAVLLMIVAVSSLSVAQQYTVTDLGTLGGKLSTPYAMNDLGQVVGLADRADGTYHAFVWSASTGMRDLGLLHADDVISFAEGINNSGQVVGVSGTSAFLWSQETGMQDLGNLGGDSSTVANSINNLGQVVGQSALPGNVEFHTFLWSQATGMQDLGTLGGTQSSGTGINDSGEIVGFSLLADNAIYHAFLWTEATGMTDIGTTGQASAANGINGVGQVVGSSTVSSFYTAFLWDSAHGMRSLGTLPSGQTYASGINVSGQVVGGFVDTQNPAYERGILWTKALGLQNLNALIQPKTPGLSWASAINKHGQIVGAGGNGHALLLTPTKQPSSQRSKP
jgi:probable HAF family extracellular repeat protein